MDSVIGHGYYGWYTERPVLVSMPEMSVLQILRHKLTAAERLAITAHLCARQVNGGGANPGQVAAALPLDTQPAQDSCYICYIYISIYVPGN